MTPSSPEVTRVLLVEDDVEDARLTARLISPLHKNPFDWVRAGTLAEAMPYLDVGFADVVLLDLNLPDSTGLETLVKVHDRRPDIPIVVLTGVADDDTTIKALQHGAQDYLVKEGADAEALVRAVRHAIQRQQLVTPLAAANDLLAKNNQRLTGLCDTAQQFVDNVSHEFRTPLTVIREFSTLLYDGLAGNVNDQQREYLNIVIDRTDDLACMVDDMLDISKLRTGLLSLRRKECRLETIVGRIAVLLARKAQIKGLNLSFDVAEELPAVYCDPEKIGRVITNLVVNAVKFTAPGGAVRVWARSDGPSQVQIGVSDDGPGINEEDLETIFDRFKQVDCPMASSSKGFGLGLAIVKELVERNFGEVKVESQLGAGSTFSFTVPVADPETLIQRFLGRSRAGGDVRVVSLLAATVDTNNEANVGPIVDEFLHSMVRADDLVLRVNPRRRLLFVGCPGGHLAEMTGRIEQVWSKVDRKCPLGEMPPIQLATVGTWTAEDGRVGLLAAAMAEFAADPVCPARPARLLIVDDEREITRSLTMRLEAAGYEVETANNGEDGLNLAIDKQPDAIILDARMPGIDGLTTLAQLRQRPETRETPVVMLSACMGDQQRAFDLGACYYLQKPCDSKTLLAALKSAIGQPRSPKLCTHEA